MDKQREIFEAEFHLFNLRTEEEDGEIMYIDDLTQGAWLGWQAALAAQRSQFVADAGIDLKGMVDAGFDANSGRVGGFETEQAEQMARVKIGNHAPLEIGSYMRVEGTPSGALKVICTREHAPAANDKRVAQSNCLTDEQLAADGYVNATAAP